MLGIMTCYKCLVPIHGDDIEMKVEKDLGLVRVKFAGTCRFCGDKYTWMDTCRMIGKANVRFEEAEKREAI